MVRSALARATVVLAVSVPLAACGLSSEDAGGPSTLPTLPPSSGVTSPPTTTAPTTPPTTAPPLTAPTGGPNTAPPIPGLEPTAPTAATAPPPTTVVGPRIQYVDEPTAGELHVGHKGNRVRTLQGELNQVGYHVSVDGYFGRGTEAAVAAFQQAQGLPADGVASPDTQARLTDLASG